MNPERSERQRGRAAGDGLKSGAFPGFRESDAVRPSRQDLAAAVDVNYQTIGYLERGEYAPSLDLAFRLSEFFGLPIEAIFSRRPFTPLSSEVYGGKDDG